MVAKRLLSVLFLIMLVGTLVPVPRAHAQGGTPPEEVQSLFDSLSPEERVGQLFLVTFNGTDTGPESQIYKLITDYHIGGVVLLAGNDNFTAAPDTLTNAQEMISNLQRVEWESSTSPTPDANTGKLPERAYVPLFVGIEQEGGGPPYDQILNGLTPIPNAMALGATWRPDMAQQIGQVQGKELSALGINLYLGPSLDVLDEPSAAVSSDIGTRSFGGDPYWVGEMGRAFIAGLHTGSDGSMLVVPKHFPGMGGSDRPVDKEVPTVRESLEQLKQIELAPFFAVTGKAPDALSTADGVLVSHIRIQGLQGNIRAATRPVSFDPSALGEILDLQELSNWHDNGGLIVSDDLGSQAVRYFYAPTNTGFSADIVARDAFLAGNDLLYLGNIVSSDLSDTYSTNIRIIDFFVQRYHEDPAFAQQVDQAVLRILTRKYQLFKQFTLSNVIEPVSALETIGQSQQLAYDVARRSATLVSPDPQELSSLLPSPPVLRDRLVFITDTVQSKQCSTCPVNAALSVNAMQDAIVRLYGPGAAGQVSAARLNSYTFDDLGILLNGAELETMVTNINRATWIVFLLSGADHGQPELLSRFLAERQDLLREKKIVLFSFTAPYYFDATDISKLSAYYSLYSNQPAFIDVAARLLYQELTPLGYSPVSIPGTGYDLIEVTSPDPNQVITLSRDLPPSAVPTGEPTSSSVDSLTPTPEATSPPEPTPIPLLGIGDTIYVRTGVIYDHNNHPVPDGTVVQFTMSLSGQSGFIQQLEQTTVGGMAQASFALEKPGLVEIQASSDPATLSDTVQLDVSSGQPAAITVIAPFPTETITPSPIPTTTVEVDPWITPGGYPLLRSWILAILFVGLSTLLTYWVSSHLQSQRWGLRWSLCVLLGGLVGYNATSFGLLGSTQVVMASGLGGVLGVSAVGELIGLGVAWFWRRQT